MLLFDDGGDNAVIAEIPDSAAQTWQLWMTLWATLDDPDYEPLAEDFDVFYSLMRRLQREGVQFDPLFVASIEQLRERAQAAGGELFEDAYDVADFEDHDPNEDATDDESVMYGKIGEMY